MQAFILLYFLNGLICFSLAYTTTDPVWLTSPFMRASNQNVIATLTGSAIDPIHTFTFSSALPGIPNLAYGIKWYKGYDSIRQ